MSEPLLDYTEKQKVPLTLFFAVAFCFTQFLFFIDEGYNSFKWMLSPANWLVFFIYLFPMVLCMYLGWRILKNKTWSVLLGLLIGTSLVIFVLLGWREMTG